MKLGMVIWRYRVYKKNQKILLKASETNIKQFLRHLKLQMMRNMRVNAAKDSSSSDDSSEDSDDSDSEDESADKLDDDPIIQVGFLKV